MKKLMKINDFKNKEFYYIPKWITMFTKENRIKAIDISVYMLAYENAKLSSNNNWIDENGNVFFILTHETIQKILSIGKFQSISSIERLIKENLIFAEKNNGKATKYFIVDYYEEFLEEKKKIKHEKSKEKIQYKNKIKNKKDTYFINDQSEKSVNHQSKITDSNQSDFNDYNNNNINNNILNNNINNNMKINVSQEELFEKFKDKISLLKNNSNISKFLSMKNISIFFNECSNEKILTKFFNILNSITNKILSINYFLGILRNLINDYMNEGHEEVKKEEKRKACNEKIQLENKIRKEQNNLRKKQIHEYDSLPEDIKKSIESKAIDLLAKTNPTTFEFMNAFKDSPNSIYLSTMKDLAIDFMQNNSLQGIRASLSSS